MSCAAGSHLAAVGGQGVVQLWSLDTMTLKRFGESGVSVRRVAFSPSAEFIAVAYENGTIELGCGRAAAIRTLASSGGAVTSLAFHPTGRVLASAGFDSRVTLWDTASGHRIVQFPRVHSDAVLSLSFAPTAPDRERRRTGADCDLECDIAHVERSDRRRYGRRSGVGVFK